MPAPVKTGRDEMRGFRDILGVGWQGADAGDAEELLQLIQEAVLMLINEGLGGWRHSPL